jgi:predicted RNase H-like nuclease (RuvC/YqgF family)
VFCFELFLSGIALYLEVIMSSSGSSKENPPADSINPYMRELKMHLKELSLKDGELQIKDVQGPKGEGSLEARMEALEQEVFKYKKMAEREVEIIYRINQELVAKYKKETTELWKDVLSLQETTNQLQAQLYDLHNQNCEYEARFQQMSAAASFRILETETSFFDGGPLPWKYDNNEVPPPPPKE